MNIVKFKDIVLEEVEGLSPESIELFNSKFKNQYTHCINWQYCITFDDIEIEDVVKVSKNPELVVSYDHLPLSFFEDYIDWERTDKANSIAEFIAYNTFTPDADITVGELKKFRTSIAQWILATELIEDDDIKHMLEYYANSMTDDVIKYLAVFGSTTLSLVSIAGSSSCGCGSGLGGVKPSVVASTVASSSCGCSSGNTSSLYMQGLNNCDPLFIYRKNLYLKMVEVFSDINFWLQFDSVLIDEIKKYVDNIINLNFDLVKSTFTSDFTDCGCVNDSLAAQERQIARLQKLSKALGYISGEADVDSDTEGISGHKNYIGTALNDWAVYLYEIMEW